MPPRKTKAKVAPGATLGAKDRQAASECWQILASLRRPFAERDAKWPIRRRIRQREESPPVPEAYSGSSLVHKSSELDFMVRQLVALLAENKEQYIIYAPQETEEAARLADDCQRAVAALMEMLEDQHPIDRPRPILHDYQVADGVAIEKITFNWDFFSRVLKSKGADKDWTTAFSDYVRDNKELPLRRTAIDPLEAYWEFDIDGLTAVAEYGRARRSALRSTYKGTENEASILNALSRIPVSDNGGDYQGYAVNNVTSGGVYSDVGDLLTVVEVWTRDEFILMAEGDNEGGEREILVRQKHPYGRPPYFFASGIITGSTNPLHKYRPLVLPMYPLSLELSAVRTARLNAAFLSSFKPFYIEYDGGNVEMDEEAGGIKVHFLTPGNNIPSIKGGKIVPINWTDLSELVKLEQSLMGDRDRFGFQAILAGNTAASGDSTAWATRMLRDQGMVQFNQVLKNYAQMREEEIRFIFKLVRDIVKDDLPIVQRYQSTEMRDAKGNRRNMTKIIKLTQKMVDAGFDIQVNLSAGKASDRISIVEEFRRAHQAGEIPMRMVLQEGWQFQNVSEIMDEVNDEQIRQQIIPDAVKLIFQAAVSGSLAPLSAVLPQNPAPNPQDFQQTAGGAASNGAPGQMNTPNTPGAINPNQPPGGALPPGAQEPGIGESLSPQEIPAGEPAPQPLQ